MIKAILATGLNGEIGQNGDIPWGRSLPKDLEYFKKVTLGETVVMGRKTFESLPFKEGLPERDNIVLSKNSTLAKNPLEGILGRFVNPYSCGVLDLDKIVWGKRVFTVIGGASVYKQMDHLVEEYHITTVHKTYPEADTFFKPDLYNFEKVGEEIDVGNGELEASVQVWRRV